MYIRQSISQVHLATDKAGQSVDECDALLKKHEAFERLIASQEEKVGFSHTNCIACCNHHAESCITPCQGHFGDITTKCETRGARAYLLASLGKSMKDVSRYFSPSHNMECFC